MHYGKTQIVVCRDAKELGRRAAADVAGKFRELLADHDVIRVVFAAGESQMTFLDALAVEPDIDWRRVICFNVDDFWDTKLPVQFTCGYQTQTQLYDKVRPQRVELVRYNAPDAHAEARRFEAVLREAGEIDVLCQGIGTSGHLALNEPRDTDFADPAWVRVVELAEQSKRQLRDDPNFKALGYIPAQGITLTIPALLAAKNLYTIVPLALKRPVLTRLFALTTPTTELPASILLQATGTLYMDRQSCPLSLLSEA